MRLQCRLYLSNAFRYRGQLAERAKFACGPCFRGTGRNNFDRDGDLPLLCTLRLYQLCPDFQTIRSSKTMSRPTHDGSDFAYRMVSGRSELWDVQAT